MVSIAITTLVRCVMTSPERIDHDSEGLRLRDGLHVSCVNMALDLGTVGRKT